MKFILASIVAFVSAFCNAQELSSSAKQEIEYLFGYLESSGCQFNRNGTWYTAAEASVHIRKKYDYLVGKGLIDTSESFIDRVATQSSISRRPYKVKCEGYPEVSSSVWFYSELKLYRGAEGN